MKRKAIIAIIWLVIIIISSILIALPPTSRNAEPTTIPLGLGIGLIPILIVGIAVSVILIKTRKKYVYSWYPPNKI
jgi:hypothetical protein